MFAHARPLCPTINNRLLDPGLSCLDPVKMIFYTAGKGAFMWWGRNTKFPDVYLDSPIVQIRVMAAGLVDPRVSSFTSTKFF